LGEPARDTLRLYRQLLQEARPYWPHILLLSFVNLLATPIALLTPVPLKIAVDSIAGSAPLPGFYRAIVPDLFGRSPTGLMIFTAGLMILIAALDEIQSFAAWTSGRSCFGTSSDCRSPTTTARAPPTRCTAFNPTPRRFRASRSMA
jgi:hypothetical protein